MMPWNQSKGMLIVAVSIGLAVGASVPVMLIKTTSEEVNYVKMQEWPTVQLASAEEIANAKLRNTPENKAAYQAASTVVHSALAAKRWTENDRNILQEALLQLTKEQFEEVMTLLLPAVNRGDVKVETEGPLF